VTLRTRALIATIAVAGTTAGLVASGAGGQSSPPPAVEQAILDQAALDHSLKGCDSRLEEFDVGPSLAGLERVHREVVCTDPQPVRTQAAGGEIDPNSLGRGHFVASVYGTCKATSDGGCAPPLQIQTWPACERSAADYTMEGQRLQPTDVLEVRGAPARFYGDDRLELSIRNVTVVVFGDSRDLVLSAAKALRTTPGSPKRVDPGEAFPAPVLGAQDGTLHC
jgi:hypothetical protein